MLSYSQLRVPSYALFVLAVLTCVLCTLAALGVDAVRWPAYVAAPVACVGVLLFGANLAWNGTRD